MKGKGLSKIALGLSVVTAILGAVVSVFQIELWLAGTQWIILAVLFGVWAIALENCDCCVKKE
jgi:hypothetical protein